jgi:hypothetical protein
MLPPFVHLLCCSPVQCFHLVWERMQAGKVLVEMMRQASDPADPNAEPVCAKLITLQGCGVALAVRPHIF